MSTPAEPAEPTGWATVVDVKTYTGADVEPALLARAAATVDLVAGRPFDLDTYQCTGRRDRYWMKLAVAYQAAWLPSQFDMFERMDVDEVSGGSANASLADGALVLGPLARQALRKVSWRRSRSVQLQGTEVGPGQLNPLSEAADDYQTWTPQGVG